METPVTNHETNIDDVIEIMAEESVCLQKDCGHLRADHWNNGKGICRPAGCHCKYFVGITNYQNPEDLPEDAYTKTDMQFSKPDSATTDSTAPRIEIVAEEQARFMTAEEAHEDQQRMQQALSIYGSMGD